jgi:phosphoribosylanthranilate isomerase
LVAAIHDLGAQVIKPLRFSAETGSCQSACADPLGAAELIAKTGVDALVLDSVSETRPAGTGRSIDWHLAGRIRDSIRQPVILAGGLHADNVTDAIRTVRPYAVDVISGVEDPVGRKNPEKVRAFVDAVSRAGRPAPLTPAEWLACHNDMFALSDRRTDSPQGFSEEHT